MRAILIVLDSLGIGAAPDADRYGDWGADTLGHLFANVPELTLPGLFSMGLGEVLAGGRREDGGLLASYGRMRPRSAGKDSVSGHWEMAGLILDEPFTVFERLPPRLVEALEEDAGVEFLGRDGLAVAGRELWKQHATTGRPILMPGRGESLIEILAHEVVMPRRRLYEICRVGRRHANAHRIARIAGQPLTGRAGAYVAAAGRHEYGMVPPRTVLNAISETGLVVEAIGKVGDVFGKSGITHPHHAATNAEALDFLERIWERMHDGLIFANLGEFDRMGHARDVAGYAKLLVKFDNWLAGFLPRVGKDDLLIITADHGNDPAFRGTDHTREEVPLLAHYDGVTHALGTRGSFADVAATLGEFFRVDWETGTAFLEFDQKKSSRLRGRR
jgi:phosphopentomutase